MDLNFNDLPPCIYRRIKGTEIIGRILEVSVSHILSRSSFGLDISYTIRFRLDDLERLKTQRADLFKNWSVAIDDNDYFEISIDYRETESLTPVEILVNGINTTTT